MTDPMSFIAAIQLFKIFAAIAFGWAAYELTKSGALYFLAQLLIWTVAPLLLAFGLDAITLAESWYQSYIMGGLLWFVLGIAVWKKTKEPILTASIQAVIGLLFAFAV